MKKNLLLFVFTLLSTLTASAYYDAMIDGIYYHIYTASGVRTAGVADGNTKYTGKVTIPTTITYYGNTYTVKSIDGCAFQGCTGLTSVTIPNSVTSICAAAFDGCSGLKSVTIGNSVTTIGNDAFAGCSALTSITIPNSVTSIGEEAFIGCSGLTSVKIGSGVTSIEREAFSNCTGLTSVTIPNSVTEIGKYAFLYCPSLTSVTIPSSVKSIGVCAFSYCSSLTSVRISDLEAWCKIELDEEGPFFDYNCAYHLYLNDIEVKDLVIPNDVTSIRAWAFQGCIGLTSVTIPNSVTSIGEYAFEYCSGLTSATIGNGVTEINGEAFAGCSGLKTVTIGSCVNVINYEAFSGCSSLTDVYCYAGNVPLTSSNVFEIGISNIKYATLHVPASALNDYKKTEPWSSFGTIVAMEDPVVETCATPTISYVDGELQFLCETEGVEFVSSITPPSAFSRRSANVSVPTTYKVTVYAIKSGYRNSDIVTKEINVGGSGGSGTGGIRGDLNGDGAVGMPDAMFIVNKMLKGKFPDEE